MKTNRTQTEPTKPIQITMTGYQCTPPVQTPFLTITTQNPPETIQPNTIIAEYIQNITIIRLITEHSLSTWCNQSPQTLYTEIYQPTTTIQERTLTTESTKTLIQIAQELKRFAH